MERQIKSWNINRITDAESVNNLQSALGVDRIVSTLLVQRNIKTFEEAKDFFRPDFNQLHDPYLMKDMDKAVDRIQQALTTNEKILIYGDYDVDGTTAVALFYSFISIETAPANVEFYIPDRYKEGYGISYQGIDYAASIGCSLIVALDCGIKSVDHIKYASEKGIDFLICDHHLPSDILPNAVAILDPKQNDCKYPYKELSGCAIGFKLAQAICIKNNLDFSILEKYLDLVAISIAADIVPVTGENRALAFFGLKKLNQKKRPGIFALMENVKQDSQKQDAEISISSIVFTIGPRINAAGRIDHGSKAVKLLTAVNYDDAVKIAEEININNKSRR
ncbi:MAG: single-stranded-DNA-specific exonuclease RecJ, partial [Bacteroidota bacterium]